MVKHGNYIVTCGNMADKGSPLMPASYQYLVMNRCSPFFFTEKTNSAKIYKYMYKTTIYYYTAKRHWRRKNFVIYGNKA